MVEENADLIYNKVSRNSKFISKQDFWIAVTHLVNESCNFVVGSNRDVKVRLFELYNLLEMNWTVTLICPSCDGRTLAIFPCGRGNVLVISEVRSRRGYMSV